MENWKKYLKFKTVEELDQYCEDVLHAYNMICDLEDLFWVDCDLPKSQKFLDSFYMVRDYFSIYLTSLRSMIGNEEIVHNWLADLRKENEDE